MFLNFNQLYWLLLCLKAPAVLPEATSKYNSVKAGVPQGSQYLDHYYS